MDPMIQNMMLPQIGLAKDKIINNTIQGANCILETLYKEPTVVGPHDPRYYTTSDLLDPTKIKITPYRTPTVF